MRIYKQKNSRIREAKQSDVEAIRNLLEQLGYPLPIESVAVKLDKIINSSDNEIFVYEHEGKVVAFISLHYSIRLVFEKDFCEIGYFVVDENSRGLKIGDEFESFACQRAKARNCCEMRLFSSLKRTDAHRFYQRKGYEQIEKYFHKLI